MFFCTLPDFLPHKRYKLQGGTPAIFFCVWDRFFCPVLCLIFYTPECIKYRAVPWHFFFLVLESKRVSILCQNVDQLLVILWSIYCHFGDFWGGWVPRRAPLTAGGSPRRLRDDLWTIFDEFWPPFGEARGALRGPFRRQSLQPGGFMSFFWCFFWCLPKRTEKATKSRLKRSLFGGGRHGSSVVNSSKKLVFGVFE